MSPKKKNAALQLLVVVLPILVFLAFLPVFYFSYTPGSADEVEKMIEVQGYPPLDQGQFYLTSVLVSDLSTLTLLESRLLAHDEVRSLDDMLGGERDYSDYNARSDILMQMSKDTASAVALREEGFEVGEEAAGVIVLAVMAEAPITSEVAVGDVIVEVEGRQVVDQAGLREILSGMVVGEEAEVTVVRGEERVTFKTALTTAGEGETTPILGIYSRDYKQYELPLEVTITTDNLSGPSAGLMLTLGIINVIRGGGLAGDYRVAGTGEILADGSVGPIGGINFKITAAADSGAQVFLAPEENYQEITEIPPGLQVFSVKNLDDALQVLDGLQGGR